VGFRTDHLLLVEIDPPRTQYPPGKDVALHQQLAAAFAAVPGVDAVTPAVLAYISNSYWNSDFVPQGKDEHAENLAEYYNVVGNNSSRPRAFLSSPGGASARRILRSR
jgi:hypothetical protein